ncbi:MAG: multidrug efflux SMR transporter [Candidatus Nanopelagicales bacterium]
MTWLMLIGAIVFEVAGTISLKLSDGFTKIAWVAVLIVCYAIAFFLLASVLSEGMPVGVAYGIWAASGVALMAIAGRFLFGDALTPVSIAGIGFIIAGVLVVELGSHA